MYLIQTNCCRASVTAEDATDPDSAVACTGETDACCTQPHHHGQAANETGQPCRPITITALGPGAAELKASS